MKIIKRKGKINYQYSGDLQEEIDKARMRLARIRLDYDFEYRLKLEADRRWDKYKEQLKNLQNFIELGDAELVAQQKNSESEDSK